MDETPVAAADAARRPLDANQAEELVIATITRHADAVLRTARRYSLWTTSRGGGLDVVGGRAPRG